MDSSSDIERTPVDGELRRQWLERHIHSGSEPEYGGRFASIETALLFDAELRRRLHPEARRFAVCLASRLQKRSSLVKASEADIERWGVDAAATVPTGRKVYKQPWGVLAPQLEEVNLLEDPRQRPYEKRELFLRLAPVYTNRRQSKPLERPTDILKSGGIPTVAVPSRYFDGPEIGELSTDAFFVLMSVYALADMAAWGGTDPAHLRVEQGDLIVSADLADMLGLEVDAALSILLDLEDRGLVWFVPVRLRTVWLPSSHATWEWLADDERGERDTFVVRPTVLPGKTPLRNDKRQFPEESVRVLSAKVCSKPGSVSLLVDELVDVPQYQPGSSVVSDRIGASMKSQIAKAAKDLRLTQADINIQVWDARPRRLLHVHKLVADALKHSVFTDDSSLVVGTIDIRRGEPDPDGRSYVRVEVQEPDAAKADYNRKIYVRPAEWRPDAQRRTSPLSAWSTYSDYVDTLEATVGNMGHPALGFDDLSEKAYELLVHIEAPKTKRFDPDNVALFGCDLMTVWLQSRGECPAVDLLVQRVVITHGDGEPSVYLELRPLNQESSTF